MALSPGKPKETTEKTDSGKAKPAPAPTIFDLVKPLKDNMDGLSDKGQFSPRDTLSLDFNKQFLWRATGHNDFVSVSFETMAEWKGDTNWELYQKHLDIAAQLPPEFLANELLDYFKEFFYEAESSKSSQQQFYEFLIHQFDAGIVNSAELAIVREELDLAEEAVKIEVQAAVLQETARLDAKAAVKSEIAKSGTKTKSETAKLDSKAIEQEREERQLALQAFEKATLRKEHQLALRAIEDGRKDSLLRMAAVALKISTDDEAKSLKGAVSNLQNLDEGLRKNLKKFRSLQIKQKKEAKEASKDLKAGQELKQVSETIENLNRDREELHKVFVKSLDDLLKVLVVNESKRAVTVDDTASGAIIAAQRNLQSAIDLRIDRRQLLIEQLEYARLQKFKITELTAAQARPAQIKMKNKLATAHSEIHQAQKNLEDVEREIQSLKLAADMPDEEKIDTDSGIKRQIVHAHGHLRDANNCLTVGNGASLTQQNMRLARQYAKYAIDNATEALRLAKVHYPPKPVAEKKVELPAEEKKAELPLPPSPKIEETLSQLEQIYERLVPARGIDVNLRGPEDERMLVTTFLREFAGLEVPKLPSAHPWHHDFLTPQKGLLDQKKYTIAVDAKASTFTIRKNNSEGAVVYTDHDLQNFLSPDQYNKLVALRGAAKPDFIAIAPLLNEMLGKVPDWAAYKKSCDEFEFLSTLKLHELWQILQDFKKSPAREYKEVPYDGSQVAPKFQANFSNHLQERFFALTNNLAKDLPKKAQILVGNNGHEHKYEVKAPGVVLTSHPPHPRDRVKPDSLSTALENLNDALRLNESATTVPMCLMAALYDYYELCFQYLVESEKKAVGPIIFKESIGSQTITAGYIGALFQKKSVKESEYTANNYVDLAKIQAFFDKFDLMHFKERQAQTFRKEQRRKAEEAKAAVPRPASPPVPLPEEEKKIDPEELKKLNQLINERTAPLKKAEETLIRLIGSLGPKETKSLNRDLVQLQKNIESIHSLGRAEKILPDQKVINAAIRTAEKSAIIALNDVVKLLVSSADARKRAVVCSLSLMPPLPKAGTQDSKTVPKPQDSDEAHLYLYREEDTTFGPDVLAYYIDGKRNEIRDLNSADYEMVLDLFKRYSSTSVLDSPFISGPARTACVSLLVAESKKGHFYFQKAAIDQAMKPLKKLSRATEAAAFAVTSSADEVSPLTANLHDVLNHVSQAEQHYLGIEAVEKSVIDREVKPKVDEATRYFAEVSLLAQQAEENRLLVAVSTGSQTGPLPTEIADVSLYVKAQAAFSHQRFLASKNALETAKDTALKSVAARAAQEANQIDEIRPFAANVEQSTRLYFDFMIKLKTSIFSYQRDAFFITNTIKNLQSVIDEKTFSIEKGIYNPVFEKMETVFGLMRQLNAVGVKPQNIQTLAGIESDCKEIQKQKSAYKKLFSKIIEEFIEAALSRLAQLKESNGCTVLEAERICGKLASYQTLLNSPNSITDSNIVQFLNFAKKAAPLFKVTDPIDPPVIAAFGEILDYVCFHTVSSTPSTETFERPKTRFIPKTKGQYAQAKILEARTQIADIAKEDKGKFLTARTNAELAALLKTIEELEPLLTTLEADEALLHDPGIIDDAVKNRLLPITDLIAKIYRMKPVKKEKEEKKAAPLPVAPPTTIPSFGNSTVKIKIEEDNDPTDKDDEDSRLDKKHVNPSVRKITRETFATNIADILAMEADKKAPEKTDKKIEIKAEGGKSLPKIHHLISPDKTLRKGLRDELKALKLTTSTYPDFITLAKDIELLVADYYDCTQSPYTLERLSKIILLKFFYDELRFNKNLASKEKYEAIFRANYWSLRIELHKQTISDEANLDITTIEGLFQRDILDPLINRDKYIVDLATAFKNDNLVDESNAGITQSIRYYDKRANGDKKHDEAPDDSCFAHLYKGLGLDVKSSDPNNSPEKIRDEILVDVVVALRQHHETLIHTFNQQMAELNNLTSGFSNVTPESPSYKQGEVKIRQTENALANSRQTVLRVLYRSKLTNVANAAEKREAEQYFAEQIKLKDSPQALAEFYATHITHPLVDENRATVRKHVDQWIKAHCSFFDDKYYSRSKINFIKNCQVRYNEMIKQGGAARDTAFEDELFKQEHRNYMGRQFVSVYIKPAPQIRA